MVLFKVDCDFVDPHTLLNHPIRLPVRNFSGNKGQYWVRSIAPLQLPSDCLNCYCLEVHRPEHIEQGFMSSIVFFRKVTDGALGQQCAEEVLDIGGRQMPRGNDQDM